MRIGMIASEFPPNRGGMEEHAGAIARWLDEKDELVVVTRDGLGVELTQGRMVHGLNGHLSHDAGILRSQHVDCWLAMSAPLVALAPLIDAPMYGYVHGLDCIRPWMPHHVTLERVAKLASKLGLSADGVVRDWRKKKIATGLRHLRGLFANSRYTAGVVASSYDYPEASIRVVHPGVDEDFLSVERRSTGSPFRLILIARLEPHARRKNVDGVIEAVALVAVDHDVVLHVVGSGTDLPYLKDLARRLAITDRVSFEGAASHEEVKSLFAQSSAFILAVRPDPGDVEGFGMVYAEAACAGLPSIAVRTGGVVEAVESGKTGILLDDASPSSVADAIRRLIADRYRFDTAYIRQYGSRRTSRRTTQQLRDVIAADLSSTPV